MISVKNIDRMIDYSYRNELSETQVLLLDEYDKLPFHKHPLWKGVLEGKFTKKEILLAESQHYLRTKEGQKLRKDAMEKCLAISETLWESIIDTYLEECTEKDGTPTHLDLIKRMLLDNGYKNEDLKTLKNTPANIAAISLYTNISDRGAGCHILGAGAVEYFYSQVSPKIFDAYVNIYGFDRHSVETYELHGPMDQEHASRALQVTDEVIKLHGLDVVISSVRDAFVATSLHYDGMLQAITGDLEYWNGK
ncbi:iron-containing redox enzyme family protein [Ekhidna sp.]|uniref:iron-containing redox enzyme family protein n=1 Tax=Ekhidna sp. TaxID=2608089 RepID=UPI003B59C52D